MNKWLIIAILSLLFIVGSLLAITTSTTLQDAKWSDDGIDMLYGIVLIVLTGFLFKAYITTQNKNIFLVLTGFLIIALVRILEIFLQEYQIAINYNPLPWVLWGLSYFITLVGVIVVVKGLLEVKK